MKNVHVVDWTTERAIIASNGCDNHSATEEIDVIKLLWQWNLSAPSTVHNFVDILQDGKALLIVKTRQSEFLDRIGFPC